MASAHLIYTPPKDLAKSLSKFTDIDVGQLNDPVGALVTSQVQERIATTKEGPDGTKWKANNAGTSTLEDTGGLRDSIHHVLEGDAVAIGSDKIYAAIQHFGGTIVPKEASHLVFKIGGFFVSAKKVTLPARPYLGLSSANIAEIHRLITSILSRLVS